jgi:hypothetical protein
MELEPTSREEMKEVFADESFVNNVGDSGNQLVAELREPTASNTFGAIIRKHGWVPVQTIDFESEGEQWRYVMFAPLTEVLE